MIRVFEKKTIRTVQAIFYCKQIIELKARLFFEKEKKDKTIKYIKLF